VLIGAADDTTTTHNLVAGNLIGTDATGAMPLGSLIGVWLRAPSNTVGGVSASARNVISANTSYGVAIEGTALHPIGGNLVEGNYIGTSASGSVALGNATGVLAGS